MAWPIDENPSKCLGLIAHPGPIAGMALSNNGRRLLTAGREDGVVQIWEVRPWQL